MSSRPTGISRFRLFYDVFSVVALIVSVVLIVTATAGCAKKKETPKPGPDEVLATFTGGKVTVGEFMIAADNKAPDSFEDRQKLVASLVNDKILAQLAHSEQKVSGPELASRMEQIYVEKLPRLLAAKITEGVHVTDEELEARRKETDATELDVSMLIALTQDGAEEALKEAKAGKDFADIVKAHPDYFAEETKLDRRISMKDDLYPVGVRAAINRLNPGEISPILKLEIGYAVVKLNKRLTPDELWAQKKPIIEKELLKAKVQNEIDELVARLYKESSVKIEKTREGYKAIVGGMTIRRDEPVSPEEGTSPHAPHSGMTEQTILGALKKTVREYLLTNEARRRGLDRDPEFRRELDVESAKLLAELYMKDMLKGLTVSRQEIQDYYENNKQKLANEELARVSRIQLDNLATAKEVVAKLRAGEEYATLAAQYSKDTMTGPKGGDVGWLQISIVKDPIRETLYGLKVGEFSEPVKSDYGYEVLMVTERRPSVVPPLSDVEETIRKRILLNKRSEQLEALLNKLYKEKDVKFNVDVLKSL